MASTLTKRKSPPRQRATLVRDAGWNLRRTGGLQILEAPALAHLRWLIHGFSTRPGGVSLPAPENGTRKTKQERVLNLGFTDWDSRANVLANRKKFFHAIGADGLRTSPIASTRQTTPQPLMQMKKSRRATRS
jgi:hypothetical protein